MIISCTSFLQASQRDDDRLPSGIPTKQSLSSRFSSFVRDNLQRSPERVVKYEVSPWAKFFVDCYNATSLYGDTIDLNDVKHFQIKSLIRENDTRQEVEDVTKHPYRNIGLIAVYDPIKDRSYIGTGSKISERHILTAAHNLVRCTPERRVFTKPHYYSMFHDGRYLDESKVSKFYIPKDYCEGGCDIAVIELAQAIQPDTFLPFCFVPQDELQDQSVRVIGYPGDYARARNPTRRPIMVEDTGKIYQINQHDFIHDANTHQGSSGGPVILERKVSVGLSAENDSDTPVIGVHISGPSEMVENDKNHATFINKMNDDMITQILAGKKPDTVDEFTIGE